MGRKEWVLAKCDKQLSQKISDENNVDPFIAFLLTGREITSKQDIEAFFSFDTPSMDPYDFMDMDKAAARILTAVDNGEKIAIYGDYDADGVTATAILYSYLSAREADVMYYIPERMTDGYGLNKDAIDFLKNENVNLIITVDNGITAIEEASYIKELHMDLVITDHHRAGEKIPDAVAVVDAFREDNKKIFTGLSGAGVALKLVTAMEGGEYNDVVDEFVDLAAIGILADISPVYNENRLIIKHGLRSINHTNRIGLMALKKAAGMESKEINSTNLMFSLIPRINAAGRIGKANRMVKLFLCDDMDEAEEIAGAIDSENAERKEIEAKILDEIEEMIRQDQNILLDRVLVFKSDKWHPGVLGITAAKLVEKYGKPAIVLNDEGEGELSGSCRSIEGFSIFDAIDAAKDLLVKFGGHTLAAGVTVKVDQFSEFKERINYYASQKAFLMPFPKALIDCKISPKGLSCDLARVLSEMEPFGVGNKEPVFGLYGYRIESIYPLKEGKHIRINLFKDNKVINTVKFSTEYTTFPYKSNDIIDAAATLSINTYKGQDQLSVIIREIRFSDVNEQEFLEGIRLYESFCRREALLPEVRKQMTPSRDEVAEVYKYIKRIKKLKDDIEIIYSRSGCKISFIKFRIILNILSEKGLIAMSENHQECSVEIIENPAKQDILTASAYEYLK